MDLQWKVKKTIPLLKKVEKHGIWCMELRKEDMLRKSIKLQVKHFRIENYANLYHTVLYSGDLLIATVK